MKIKNVRNAQESKALVIDGWQPSVLVPAPFVPRNYKKSKGVKA